jgi:hypothetical protein
MRGLNLALHQFGQILMVGFLGAKPKGFDLPVESFFISGASKMFDRMA